jgi:S1-C subfamily serine protease
LTEEQIGQSVALSVIRRNEKIEVTVTPEEKKAA